MILFAAWSTLRNWLPRVPKIETRFYRIQNVTNVTSRKFVIRRFAIRNFVIRNCVQGTGTKFLITKF